MFFKICHHVSLRIENKLGDNSIASNYRLGMNRDMFATPRLDGLGTDPCCARHDIVAMTSITASCWNKGPEAVIVAPVRQGQLASSPRIE